jgi:hypothetical protein
MSLTETWMSQRSCTHHHAACRCRHRCHYSCSRRMKYQGTTYTSYSCTTIDQLRRGRKLPKVNPNIITMYCWYLLPFQAIQQPPKCSTLRRSSLSAKNTALCRHRQPNSLWAFMAFADVAAPGHFNSYQNHYHNMQSIAKRRGHLHAPLMV